MEEYTYITIKLVFYIIAFYSVDLRTKIKGIITSKMPLHIKGRRMTLMKEDSSLLKSDSVYGCSMIQEVLQKVKGKAAYQNGQQYQCR